MRKDQRKANPYKMEKVNYQNHEMRRWDVGPSTFLALPEDGARLINWHINMSDGSVRDVIHWPEENHGGQLSEIHGGIPILFPFAGKCFLEGKEDFWKLPTGEHCPMPLHGFAKEAKFRIRSIDQSGFEVEMIQTPEMKAFYPFDYTFTVIYHFLELTLQISLILENEGKEPIPWSAGLHPYFQVPWRKDLSLSDHKMEIDAKKVLQYQEGGMMAARRSIPNVQTLEDPDLINSIYYELNLPSAEISLLNDEETLRVSEVGGANVGSRLTFVSWTKPGAAYFCLEPWMSPPNAPEAKTLKMVPPTHRDEFTVEVELA